MRILQLKTASGRGGAETLVLQLTNLLARHGHDVLTIVGEHGWLDEALAASGQQVTHLPLFSASDVRYIPKLMKLIRQHRSDVVLAHGARVNFIGTLASHLAHTPSVSVEHNVDAWRTTSPMLNIIDRWCARMNSHRIAVSHAVFNMLLEKHILPTEKITVVPNGIEFPTSSWDNEKRSDIRSRFGLSESDFVIVTVARLSKQKGHSYLLDAIPPLAEECPNMRFLFLGDGELRQELTVQAESHGIQRCVTFAGAVDGVVHLLPAFDLFVLPSLWEGMPIAIIEAMGMGLPVIATNVAGIPEVIVNHETGILVPPRDSRALHSAIRELVADPDLRKQFAQAGQKYARLHHSIDVLANKYLDVFNHIM